MNHNGKGAMFTYIPSTDGLVEVSCSKRSSCDRAEDEDSFNGKKRKKKRAMSNDFNIQFGLIKVL